MIDLPFLCVREALKILFAMIALITILYDYDFTFEQDQSYCEDHLQLNS